jgi:hypothetical protein
MNIKELMQTVGITDLAEAVLLHPELLADD